MTAPRSKGPVHPRDLALVAGRPRATEPVDPAATLLAAGQTRRLQHEGPAGARSFDLYYQPAGSSDDARPLLIMLHGGQQDAADFAAGTGMDALADRHDFLVAIPSSPGRRIRAASGTGSAQDQHPTAANRRSSPASPGRSPTTTPSIRAASTSPACPPVGRWPPCWRPLTPISTPLSACTPASPTALPRDLPSAMSAMMRGAGDDAPAGPAPLIVFHGDRDTSVAVSNAWDRLVAARLAAAYGPDAEHPVPTLISHPGGADTRPYTRTVHSDSSDLPVTESWIVGGGGHTWFGGSPAGSYTDPQGPDASAELVRFFFSIRRSRRRGLENPTGAELLESAEGAQRSLTGAPVPSVRNRLRTMTAAPAPGRQIGSGRSALADHLRQQPRPVAGQHVLQRQRRAVRPGERHPPVRVLVDGARLILRAPIADQVRERDD